MLHFAVLNIEINFSKKIKQQKRSSNAFVVINQCVMKGESIRKGMVINLEFKDDDFVMESEFIFFKIQKEGEEYKEEFKIKIESQKQIKNGVEIEGILIDLTRWWGSGSYRDKSGFTKFKIKAVFIYGSCIHSVNGKIEILEQLNNL